MAGPWCAGTASPLPRRAPEGCRARRGIIHGLRCGCSQGCWQLRRAAPHRRQAHPARPPAPQDLLPEDGAARRGRITIYCVAENIDRKALELRLRERGGNYLLQQYPDVLYGQIESTQVCVWVGGCRWDREGRRWVWRHGGALGRDCGGAPACMPLLGGK